MQINLRVSFSLTVSAFLIITFSAAAQIQDFVSTDFRNADSIAHLYPKHSLQDLKSLSEKLTKPLTTEHEKFRAIYTWVCNNIDNDYTLFTKNKSKRDKLKDQEALKQWNKEFNATVFTTLLKKHKTVCTGYAYLLKKLAHYSGINCIIINGYGRTAQANIGGTGIANHSWNAVQLNNKWYLCDATWSSGSIDLTNKNFVRKYDDTYFLLAPSLFVRNHYPLDSTWILLDNKLTLEEFLNRPIIYSSALKLGIDQLQPETFNITVTKGETVSFKFSKYNENKIEKIQLLIDGQGANPIFPQLYKNSMGLYCIDHTFKTRGVQVLHIMLDNNFVFTYSVVVK
jgi:transglutaminase/protease-like cytokinesis protein 3